MNKIIKLIAVGMIIMCGCDNVDVRSEIAESKVIEYSYKGRVCHCALTRIKFEGHTYILRDECHRGGICHDPDCKCNR